MSDHSDSPRMWGITTDADWEIPTDRKPPDKRHPYPGEIDFLQAEAVRAAGNSRVNTRDASWWQRRVSRLFYALCLRRRIYIEGA